MRGLRRLGVGGGFSMAIQKLKEPEVAIIFFAVVITYQVVVVMYFIYIQVLDS